jgi:hypothetical protein
VTISFGEGRAVLGLELPHAVQFSQGGEYYRYRFRSVLPFRLAPPGLLPHDPALLFERLGDLHRIVALHERGMQAHRDGDVEALVGDQVEAGIVSGRGQLTGNTREATRRRLGPYLSSTTFERYTDVVAPVVCVSRDGTLGWLACEMEASGVRRTASGEREPLELHYTWVELVVARDGRWWRNGNASSARR